MVGRSPTCVRPPAGYGCGASPGQVAGAPGGGDERAVPPDHPESNYGMARETLLAHVSIPTGNVHRIRGEEGARAAARDYEDVLRAFFGAAPRLDLGLLGMGADGHAASLFPGGRGLDDPSRWVVPEVPPAPGVERITLTLRALAAASRVVFLVAGASKAPALARVLGGGPDAAALPAARVHPSAGSVLWLVDRAAALRK